MPIITCGVIIKYENKFLVCHPTGARWKRDWSVPKGCQDPGETYQQTAVREVFEETGIKLSESKLKFLGKEFYRTGKDIVLFETNITNIPATLHCDSLLDNGKPEVDSFSWITYEKAEAYLNKNLFRVFTNLVKEF